MWILQSVIRSGSVGLMWILQSVIRSGSVAHVEEAGERIMIAYECHDIIQHRSMGPGVSEEIMLSYCQMGHHRL